MRDLSECEVHLVTDRGLSKGRSTLEIVEAAARGRVSVVQFREKHLETRDFYEEGLKIRDLLRSLGIVFIVNDRIDLALALDADGVHLGQSDMPMETARKILGPDKIIGLSVEEPKHINEQAGKYANYLGVSPIFVTSTKPELESGWGLDGLRKARSMTDLPLVAIGSINAENAEEVINAGADSVAVVSAIVSADDPQQAARSLVEQVRKAKTRRS